MHRWFCVLGTAAFFACGDPSSPRLDGRDVHSSSIAEALDEAAVTSATPISDVRREHVTGDIYHYSFVVRVGQSANAKLRVHRVTRERLPWVARPASDAVMLLHGDFATFATNFLAPDAPSLAVFLAREGLDVWGVDRRWTLAPSEGADLSDFGGMGLAEEADDVGRALALARAARGASGAGAGPMFLIGFSRGGLLAYTTAAADAERSAAQRQLKGLVPLDVYAEIAPADVSLKQRACESRDEERALLDQGAVDSDNGFFIRVGSLAQAAPNDPSPLMEGSTNRDVLLEALGKTFEIYPVTPLYHLMAGVLEGGVVTGLRESSETVASAWFARAPLHQPTREAFDSDALWCDDGPLPVHARLARIHVPLFYIGAGGGFGEYGLYSTSRVASADVSTRIIHRFGAARRDEDFGHGDLLYGRDAESLAWRPLAAWLHAHGAERRSGGDLE